VLLFFLPGRLLHKQGPHSGSRIITQAGNRITTQAGNRIATQAGNRIATQAGSRIITQAGSRITTQAGKIETALLLKRGRSAPYYYKNIEKINLTLVLFRTLTTHPPRGSPIFFFAGPLRRKQR
jgi:hypothetical protein